MISKTFKLLIVIALVIVLSLLFIYEHFFLIFMYSSIIEEFKFILYVLITMPFILLGALYILEKRRSIDKKIMILYTVITITIYMLFLPLAFNGINTYFSKFNSETWKEHVNIRHIMINDLEKNYLFEGMSKDEVIKLLGTPYMNDEKSNEIYYDIGINFPDYNSYCIVFKDNKVVKLYIRDF